MENKVMPHDLDLEAAVLGAMLLEKNCIFNVIDLLTENHFYKQEHKYIFLAIKEMFTNSEPIDLLTIINHLRENKKLNLVGGPVFVAQIMSRVTSSHNIDFHSKVLTELAIKRTLISICGALTIEAYNLESDSFELLNSTEKALFDIKTKSLTKNAKDLSTLTYQTIKSIEARLPDVPVGIQTGIYELDEIIGGWQKSDLVIIAARPGMGKSILALMAANHAAINLGIPTAIFSLEMSETQLMYRLLSMRSNTLSNNRISKDVLTEDEKARVRSLGSELMDKKLFIDDTPGLSLFDFRTKCRRLVSQHKIELIIVDYLQLMANPEKGKSRIEEVSSISRGLKIVAKELNVPVIALCQLSRNIESRGEKAKPQLSDIRESGQIEADADVVIMLSKGYEDEQNEVFKKVIDVVKQRNGKLHSFEIEHEQRFVRFRN